MKRSAVLTIIILGLALSLAGPFRAVQAVNLIFFADLDQDGISDAMENSGWYNLAGGPYVTNPNQADSDHDGLTDAEEKLFNFSPTDPTSPGISVQYESAYKTFEYYNATDPAYLAMVQGGNRYLLTEGLVVRRGTTFKVAAVNTGAASLTITGAGLTALTPTPDPARGGWKVTVPTNGTVGTYTATITNGAWSKSMPIYVIFELPTDLTQAQLNAYLYDDDSANKRDEVAVWWRSVDWKYYNADSEVPTPCLPGDTVCSDWQYHTNSGFSQAFWTEQFTKQVLVSYTLPAIQGKTSQYSAAEAISAKADASVRLNYDSVKNSFSSATKVFTHPDGTFTSNGGACETSAGVFTAMLRSVGIASRPFALDYNKTVGHGEQGNFGKFEYDHAVMLWVKSPSVASNRWYAERTFSGEEADIQTTPEWISGSTGMRLLSEVGIYNPAQPHLQFNKFQDTFADLIQSANEGWDFQVGSLGGGMVNTQWDGIDVPAAEFTNYVQNRDFKWDSKRPLVIQQSPYVDIFSCQLWKGDGWAPSEWYDSSNPLYASNPAGRNAKSTYILPSAIPSSTGDIENWPYNPQPTSCPASSPSAACEAFKAAWQAVCAGLPGQGTPGLLAQQPQPFTPSVSALDTSIQLGNIISDSGVDLNGDGLFDQLIVTFELTSSQEGEFQLGGWLRAGDELFRTNQTQISLTTGSQVAQITFDGQKIGDNNYDGPYQVEAIWIAPVDQPVSELALPEEMAAYQTYTYVSQPYLSSAFTVLPASITGDYSYTGTDTNENGLFDLVTISVPLDIAIPGDFMVEADLYGGNGDFVGHAVWTGSDPVASLEFAVAGTVPPYSLEHLNLFEAEGKSLASFYAPVFTIDDLEGMVDQANIVPGSSSSVLSPQSVVPIPTNTFTAAPIDLDSNGKYDKLVVSAGVDVTVQDGSYWIEGLLVNSQKIPVAWSVSQPQLLTVGQNRIIQMDYDAGMLFDHLPLTGNGAFTLIAVKIFKGTPGLATLEASIPVTGFSTAAYSRSQFEPSNRASILFQDDMESGAGKWTVTNSSQWSLTSDTWHSSTKAWMAVGSTTKSGLLTLAAPLDLTNYSNPLLRFNSAYRLPGTNSVKLEVSTNGTTWTTVKTYTGSTDYWSTELVDLSAYGNTPGVRIRFNAQAINGALWYVDDAFVMNTEPTRTFFLPFITR